jgi:hypothetical protein
MSSSGGAAVSWSTQVGQAGWIAERLAAPDVRVVGSVVPGGFEAYVRILHPVVRDLRGVVPKLRWSELSSWSGRPLEADSQFHSFVLPLEERESPSPSGSERPRQGSLEGDELVALIDVLGRHTSTPGRCWFCIWEGYGWQDEAPLASRAELAGRLADPPIPTEVRDGTRVALPGRNYFLYTGPLDAALAFIDSEGQSPNLFWPEDQSWCVASEIDLSSTYVGGSHQLRADLLGEERIEAIAADPSDASFRIDPWVVDLVESSVDTLISSRRVAIDSAVGFIYASMAQSRLRRGAATFAIATARADGTTVNRQKAVRMHRGDDLRAALVRALTRAVIDLVGE